MIVATAGIWGTIIYRVVNGISPDAPEISNAISVAEFKPKTIAKTESFTISDIDRDPFLGTLKTKKNTTPTKKTISQKNTVNVPIITFSGIVQHDNDRVFILTINGKQYLMRKGQSVNDVRLVSGNSKQVAMRFNNINTTILVD